MSQKIINLTLLLVIEEVENTLREFPTIPYQLTFSEQELRQKLIDRVLTQTPNYYAILEESEKLPEDPTLLYSCLEEQIRLKKLIRESVIHLFRENIDSDRIVP